VVVGFQFDEPGIEMDIVPVAMKLQDRVIA
jgi:hypothetical protein